MQGRDADISVSPIAILDRKLVNKGNKRAGKFLVQWDGRNPKNASWQDAEDIESKFPKLAIRTG